jgi:hypothetical protein
MPDPIHIKGTPESWYRLPEGLTLWRPHDIRGWWLDRKGNQARTHIMELYAAHGEGIELLFHSSVTPDPMTYEQFVAGLEQVAEARRRWQEAPRWKRAWWTIRYRIREWVADHA